MSDDAFGSRQVGKSNTPTPARFFDMVDKLSQQAMQIVLMVDGNPPCIEFGTTFPNLTKLRSTAGRTTQKHVEEALAAGVITGGPGSWRTAPGIARAVADHPRCPGYLCACNQAVIPTQLFEGVSEEDLGNDNQPKWRDSTGRLHWFDGCCGDEWDEEEEE